MSEKTFSFLQMLKNTWLNVCEISQFVMEQDMNLQPHFKESLSSQKTGVHPQHPGVDRDGTAQVV